jgi:hypothetical protein
MPSPVAYLGRTRCLAVTPLYIQKLATVIAVLPYSHHPFPLVPASPSNLTRRTPRAARCPQIAFQDHQPERKSLKSPLSTLTPPVPPTGGNSSVIFSDTSSRALGFANVAYLLFSFCNASCSFSISVQFVDCNSLLSAIEPVQISQAIKSVRNTLSGSIKYEKSPKMSEIACKLG